MYSIASNGTFHLMECVVLCILVDFNDLILNSSETPVWEQISTLESPKQPFRCVCACVCNGDAFTVSVKW